MLKEASAGTCLCIFTIVIVSLNVCMFINVIWGSIILADNNDARHGCLNVWIYCLMTIIGSGLGIVTTQVVRGKKDDKESKGGCGGVITILALV